MAGPTPFQGYGVQSFTESQGTGLDLARDAGVRWVRIVLSWASVEPNPPAGGRHTYRWADFDARVQNVIGRGLTPLVLVQGNPSWAATTACGPIDKASTGDLAAFLAAAAARHRAIRYWELYNEPDNADADNFGWLGGCFGLAPQAYVAALKAVHPALRKANAQAQLVLGALAHESWSTGPFSLSFLDDILNAGAAPYFDVMNFHFYNGFRNRWDGTLPFDQDIMGKTAEIRRILAAHQVAKPIICSELGLNRAMIEDTARAAEYQARYVPQALARGMAAGLEVLVWFQLSDHPPESWGLLREDFQPNPAYTAYQVVTRQLSGYTYQDQLVFPDDKVQAYRFRADRAKLVLFSDAQDRWEHLSPGYTDYRTTVTLSAEHLGAWSGRLRVTDKFGQETVLDSAGAPAIRLAVSPSPVYVEVVT